MADDPRALTLGLGLWLVTMGAAFACALALAPAEASLAYVGGLGLLALGAGLLGAWPLPLLRRLRSEGLAAIRGDTQAGYALALRFELLDENRQSQAAAHLVEAIDRYRQFLASDPPRADRRDVERWVAELEGGRNDDIVDLLAIRVVWEALFVATCERPAHRAQWLQSLRCWPRELRPEQFRAMQVNLILQRALEIGYQRRVVAGLRQASGARPVEDAPRPVAQAAFCIDVRSEVFRRALETADGTIETQGFAGFFGVMAEYRPLGADRSQAHLPVLLPPRYRVCETAGEGGGARTAALLARRKRLLGLSKAWKQFKLSSASCFSFVESAWLLYVLKLVTDSLGWTRPVPHPETVGLGRLDAAALAPGMGDGRRSDASLVGKRRPGEAHDEHSQQPPPAGLQ